MNKHTYFSFVLLVVAHSAYGMENKAAQKNTTEKRVPLNNMSALALALLQYKERPDATPTITFIDAKTKHTSPAKRKQVVINGVILASNMNRSRSSSESSSASEWSPRVVESPRNQTRQTLLGSTGQISVDHDGHDLMFTLDL